jgi:hypothetical protein
VPLTSEAFLARNLTTQATFFGCDTKKANSPLLVYIPNAPPLNGNVPLTNTSTSQLAYEPFQLQSMLDQTFIIGTQGRVTSLKNSTAIATGATSDSKWAACLACAVVDRARQRKGVARNGVCTECFDRYCWNPWAILLWGVAYFLLHILCYIRLTPCHPRPSVEVVAMKKKYGGTRRQSLIRCAHLGFSALLLYNTSGFTHIFEHQCNNS